MLRLLRKKRGQSTIEYIVVVLIVIGALLTIQVYVKRGLQGRYKQATDSIGEQFSPGNTNYHMTSTTEGSTRETFFSGTTRSDVISNEVSGSTGSYNIINVDQEFWGATP